MPAWPTRLCLTTGEPRSSVACRPWVGAVSDRSGQGRRRGGQPVKEFAGWHTCQRPTHVRVACTSRESSGQAHRSCVSGVPGCAGKEGPAQPVKWTVGVRRQTPHGLGVVGIAWRDHTGWAPLKAHGRASCGCWDGSPRSGHLEQAYSLLVLGPEVPDQGVAGPCSPQHLQRVSFLPLPGPSVLASPPGPPRCVCVMSSASALQGPPGDSWAPGHSPSRSHLTILNPVSPGAHSLSGNSHRFPGPGSGHASRPARLRVETSSRRPPRSSCAHQPPRRAWGCRSGVPGLPVRTTTRHSSGPASRCESRRCPSCLV